MKITFILLATVLLTATLWAQSPEKMSYQTVIHNSSNQLVSMKISIVQGVVDGAPVYVETQTPRTNANGLVSIHIGTGIVESGSFTAIDWANCIYFIKTETDPTGGLNYTITGTSQLMSVPYALYTKTAESADNINITGNEIVFDGWDKDSTNDFDGKYSSLNEAPSNVSDFTNDTGFLTEFTEVDGDTINEIQDLQLVGNNLTITNNGIATTIDLSQYLGNTDIQLTEAEVDAFADNNGYLETEVDGDTTNEIQNLAEVSAINDSVNTRLKNVTDPTEARDAATKAYVDVLENKLNILKLKVKVNAGTSVSDLLGAGTSVSDLLDAGVNASDLINAGISISDLLDAGVNASNLLDAGISVDDLIGLAYQGGKIAYIYENGDSGYVEDKVHGFIAASSDQSESIAWYSGSSITNALDTTLGAGNANTETIVSVQGTTESYAARICADLNLEGYDDWYLPSKGQLSKLWTNRFSIGGFDNYSYWSSSEVNESRVWNAFFLPSEMIWFMIKKDELGGVRAVRSF